MAETLSLTTSQRKKVLHCYRRHPDPAMRSRAHLILLLGAGHSWVDVCATLFCSLSTISRWKRRFEQGGLGALLDLNQA